MLANFTEQNLVNRTIIYATTCRFANIHIFWRSLVNIVLHVCCIRFFDHYLNCWRTNATVRLCGCCSRGRRAIRGASRVSGRIRRCCRISRWSAAGNRYQRRSDERTGPRNASHNGSMLLLQNYRPAPQRSRRRLAEITHDVAQRMINMSKVVHQFGDGVVQRLNLLFGVGGLRLKHKNGSLRHVRDWRLRCFSNTYIGSESCILQ